MEPVSISVILPRLCRKLLPKDLWKLFKAAIISKQVDYVQAILVQEPIEILQEIIDALISTTEKEKLSEYLTATNLFLKYRYNHHVSLQHGNCFTHNVSYILRRNLIVPLELIYVCNKIRTRVIDNVTIQLLLIQLQTLLQVF